MENGAISGEQFRKKFQITRNNSQKKKRQKDKGQRNKKANKFRNVKNASRRDGVGRGLIFNLSGPWFLFFDFCKRREQIQKW